MSPVAALIFGSPPRRAKPGTLLAALFGFLLAVGLTGSAWSAPVVEGPRSEVTTITCSIAEDGATTCAVSQGSASVCSLRKGQDIKRSYWNYPYLDQPPGCALGADYWLAHAPGGGGNYDKTWDRIGSEGATTAFFGSERSFLDMLSAEPDGNDAYAALAKVYIATDLNRQNGATLPEAVEAAQNEASVLLLGSPSGGFDGEAANRSRELAVVLSEFVAGRSGPGLCQVMTQPLGPDDVGKTLVGVDSKDQGTILSLDENRDRPGEGVVTIGALTSEDQFIYADEPFTVDGIRKARFTQDTNDCATVDAGEETTVAVGGIPSDPTAISAFMQQLARNLQVMIALNTESEAPPAPAAGPGSPTGLEGSSAGGGTSSGIGGGGFPSGLFPSVGGSGGSQCVVPNIVGLTEGQARGRLSSAGLSVGDVTVVSSLSPLRGLVSTAYAQTQPSQPVVVSQQPAAGSPCTSGDAVDLLLSAESQGMPEPSSLPMLAIALAALGFLLWRGRRGGASGAAIVLLVLGVSGCENRAAEERIGLARQFLDSGRPNGAVIELKRAIQAEPGNAEARRLLGQAYVGLGRLNDAEKELIRALSIEPGDSAIALALAKVWLRQGHTARLLSDLKPQDAWSAGDRSAAWTLRAEAELATGRLEEARGSFETAAELDASRIEPLVGLVRVANLSKRDEAARAALERALALAPADPTLLGLAGQRLFRSGDYGAAEDFFRRQLAGAPDNLTGRIDLAQALMAEDRDSDAEAELARVLASAPDHPDALYLVAVTSLRRGDYAAAAKQIGKALRVRPQDLPSRSIAAIAAMELGRWEEARAHLETIEASDPAHPLLSNLRPRVRQASTSAAGHAHVRPRPLQQDLTLFRLNLDGVPGIEEALRGLGRGETDWLPALQHELTKAPDPWATRGMALAEYRAGRPVDARFALQGRLERQPGDADTRMVLADLYLLDGNPDAALPHLRKLALQRPRDPGVLNNLAWVMYLRGELREAGIVSERALALSPRDPRIMDTRGLILLQAGDADRAVELLSRAAGSDAAPPESRIHLAQALIGRGDEAAARIVLTQTLAAPDAASQHRAASILLQKLEP